MRRRLFSILSVLILVVGILLMIYPAVSNYWNSLHQSWAIAGYAGQLQMIEDDIYKEIWNAAKDYNQTLLYKCGARVMEEEEMRRYNKLLNPGGDGLMGYLQIPSIEVTLPIYHGTDEAILQIAAGHVEWSSLPVGGESTHCVLSGHRGLPSAQLLTDLDQVKNGDQMILKVMDEKLIYEVDQILVVEPDETDELRIHPGQDFCTLVTCTPYGINSHRLLVRGKRIMIEKEAPAVRITADAVLVKIPEIPFVCIIIIILGVGIVNLKQICENPIVFR